MRFFKLLLIGLGFFMFSSGWAQRINNIAAYQNFSGDKYFRLYLDNDMFFKTDYYYSHGNSIEIVHPFLIKNPLSIALLKPKNSDIRYGIALEHFTFTPEKIEEANINYEDRPYAASLLLNSFSVTTNYSNQTRLSSTLSVGLVGRMAMAQKMQGLIHEWTGSDEPLGWSHQIRSDFLINYEVNHEKELFAYSNLFHVISQAQIRAGSYNSRLQAGLTFIVGKYKSPFHQSSGHKNFQLYLYSQPVVNGVIHDATLQGGLFNRRSPYTLRNSDLKRIVWQNSAGIVVTYNKYFLEINGAFLSPEFDGGKPHRWGGIVLGFLI